MYINNVNNNSLYLYSSLLLEDSNRLKD